MKIKDLNQVNDLIKQLDLTSPKVKEALQTLQERITTAENASEAPKIREQIAEVQLQLKEIQLAKQLRDLEKQVGEIDLEFEPVSLKAKIPEQLKGLLFE